MEWWWLGHQRFLSHPVDHDPGEGPSNLTKASGDPCPDVEIPVEDVQAELESNGDFLHEQREDPTLSRACEQASSPDQEGVTPQPPQGSQFEVQRDCLYWVVKDPDPGEHLTVAGPPQVAAGPPVLGSHDALGGTPEAEKDPAEGSVQVLLARHTSGGEGLL